MANIVAGVIAVTASVVMVELKETSENHLNVGTLSNLFKMV